MVDFSEITGLIKYLAGRPIAFKGLISPLTLALTVAPSFLAGLPPRLTNVFSGLFLNIAIYFIFYNALESW